MQFKLDEAHIIEELDLSTILGKLPQKTSYSGPKLFPEPKKAPMSKNKEGIMRPKKVVGKNVGEANKWEKISLHKQPAHVKSKQPQDSTGKPL